MGRKEGIDYSIFIMAIVIILALYVLFYYPDLLGIPVGASDTFIALFPGLFLTGICIVVYYKGDGYSRISGGVGLGFGLALLVANLNAEGMMTAQILHGLTVPQCQVALVALGFIIGVVSYSRN